MLSQGCDEIPGVYKVPIREIKREIPVFFFFLPHAPQTRPRAAEFLREKEYTLTACTQDFPAIRARPDSAAKFVVSKVGNAYDARE